MSLTNIKSNIQSERGFTIVELLIVVVVIAILAAITIVSYNGITRSANASSAKSALATMQKKLEAYNAEEGRYPIAATELTSTAAQAKSYGMSASAFGTSDPTPDGTTTKGTGYVRLQACRNVASGTALAAGNIVGIRISYYEYDKSPSPGVTTVDLGTCPSTTISNLN